MSVNALHARSPQQLIRIISDVMFSACPTSPKSQKNRIISSCRCSSCRVRRGLEKLKGGDTMHGHTTRFSAWTSWDEVRPMEEWVAHELCWFCFSYLQLSFSEKASHIVRTLHASGVQTVSIVHMNPEEFIGTVCLLCPTCVDLGRHI